MSTDSYYMLDDDQVYYIEEDRPYEDGMKTGIVGIFSQLELAEEAMKNAGARQAHMRITSVRIDQLQDSFIEYDNDPHPVETHPTLIIRQADVEEQQSTLPPHLRNRWTETSPGQWNAEGEFIAIRRIPSGASAHYESYYPPERDGDNAEVTGVFATLDEAILAIGILPEEEE